jgi:Amidohydrolase
LGVPIYLHPNRPPQAVIDACYSGLPSAVSNALATGAWGWHIDTGLHVLRLIVSGVFDAFPALNLIIGHMGEALPSMIWRADTMLKKFVSLQRPVHQYFSDNVYVTTSGIFDHPPFAAALHSIGTDRILFSVDYPYSDNLEAISFFKRLPLSASDREKVAHGNADRLLRLGVEVYARDVAVNHGAGETQLVDRAVKLGGRRRRIRHRQSGKAGESVRMAADRLRQRVVGVGSKPPGLIRLQALGRGHRVRYDLHVNPGGVHTRHPQFPKI